MALPLPHTWKWLRFLKGCKSHFPAFPVDTAARSNEWAAVPTAQTDVPNFTVTQSQNFKNSLATNTVANKFLMDLQFEHKTKIWCPVEGQNISYKYNASFTWP